MRTRLDYLFLVPLLLVCLTSCGVIPSSLKPREASVEADIPATSDQVVLVTDETSTSKNVTSTFYYDISLLLEEKKYLSALSTIRQEVENGYPESALASEYLQALRGVLQRGDALMAKGVLDKAGNHFRAALDGFPGEKELIEKAPLSVEGINSKIQACADQLMEDGLLAYREGDLDTAIGIWEKILAFLPQHEASQKAIHTANLQLNNLKSIDQNQ